MTCPSGPNVAIENDVVGCREGGLNIPLRVKLRFNEVISAAKQLLILTIVTFKILIWHVPVPNDAEAKVTLLKVTVVGKTMLMYPLAGIKSVSVAVKV